MKIALISPLPPYRGGIATFSHLLASHLHPRHELYAVNFRRLYPQILFPGRSQFNHRRTDITTIRTDAILDVLAPPSWDLAARRIEAFQPDICLFAYWMPFFIPAYWRLIKLLQPRCRTVVLCHNVEEHESIAGLRWLKRRFFQAADRLVVLSSVSLQQLKSLSVTTPTVTLFHPLPTVYGDEQPQEAAKAQLGVPPDTPLILFFGLVRPYKGLFHLLEAARTLRRQGSSFYLWVAGEFYQGYDETAAFVSREDLTEHITLEDRFIPDQEVAKYFSAADVVALPYLTATQSGVVPIAYHFNRPVVVTEVGGLPEMVRQGETGYLVPPGDSSKLAEVLGQNMPDGFRVMRRNVARVKGQFSWKSFVTQLEQFLS
jgi:glycosyltransferase involved in cell wall biosynthesis